MTPGETRPCIGDVSPQQILPSAHFWLLLTLNLLAAYLPSLVWVEEVSAFGNQCLWYLYSPICFLVLFLKETNSLLPLTVILIVFWCVIMGASWAMRRERIAMAVMPLLLFVVSLLQGLLFADFLRGLDAIGHS